MDNYVNHILIHQLKLGGFANAELMTDEQRDLIAEPSDAPENFYHDGEVTTRQAVDIWTTKMKKAGLTNTQIAKAYKFNNIAHSIKHR